MNQLQPFLNVLIGNTATTMDVLRLDHGVTYKFCSCGLINHYMFQWYEWTCMSVKQQGQGRHRC